MRLSDIPLPDLSALRGLVAALLLFALCAGAGAFLRGRSGWKGADFFVGYAAVSFFVIVVGMLPWRVPLTFAAGCVVAAGLVAAIVAARRWRDHAMLLRALLLLLPFLFVLSALPPLEWDDLSQWVPNAAYLYRYDALPQLGLPPSTSYWPGYPYAMPIWTWLVSCGSGGFVANAGAVASALFLAASAGLIAQAVRDESRLAVPPSWWLWAVAAAATLLVTILAPSFRTAYSFTGYADSATGAVTMATAFLASRVVWSAETTDRTALVPLALTGLLLVSLKQANLVLLALLCGGFLVAGLRAGSGGRAVRVVLAALPGVALWFAWDRFVARNMPAGEFHWLPAAQWRWPRAADIVAGMLQEGRTRLHFPVIVLLALFGIRALWRGPRNAAEHVAIASAIMLVGYTLFLFATYLGASFNEGEAVRAASFFRYSSHLGALSVLGLAMLAAPLLGRLAAWGGAPLRWAALALPLIAALLLPLRWDRLVAAGLLPLQHMGEELAAGLPEGATVAVIAPRDDGTIANAVRYHLQRFGRDDRKLALGAVLLRDDPAATRAIVESASHVLLADVPSDVAGAFGRADAIAGYAWLERKPEGWALIREWPRRRLGRR